MAYTSKLNAIVARVQLAVASVSGIDTDQVHDGERDLQSRATWQALGWDASYHRPSGWYVERLDSSGENSGLASSTSHLRLRTHRLQIVGWLGIDDPQTGTTATSSTTWRQRVEDVCTAIREDLYTSAPLGGTAIGGDPPQVITSELRDLRGVTCHYAEIEMTAIERIAWS